MFQLKTSWISLIAAWFFDSSRAKMPPTPTKLFLSPQIVTGAVQPHLSHVKGVCPSQLGGGTFSDAARRVGSSRTSRESSWLAAPGMPSLHRTHAALQENSLSDGTSNFHLNSAGILNWKQPVN